MKKKNTSFGEAIAIGAALTGAALGAAAVVLSDKKNQAKIKKTVDDLSDEAVKIGKSVKSKVDEFATRSTSTGSTKTAPKKAPVKKASTPSSGKVYTPKKK